MTNNMFTLAVIGCMAGTMFLGCAQKSETRVENAKQDLRDSRSDVQADWQQFKSEASRKIDANEQTIDQLKEKIKVAGSKLEARYNNDVAELAQKNRDLKGKLENYKDEGKDKWEVFRQKVSSDLDGLGKALKDLTAGK